MSESRAILPGRRPGLAHHRRVFERAGEALWSAVYGSALYRVSLRGRRPESLALNPRNPWPGDAARGDALLRREYRFGGQTVSGADGPPWHAQGANPAWVEEMHGFTWLSDLEAVGTAEARAAARDAVARWIDRCGAWDPIVWRPDVLGRRVVAWLTHAAFLLHVADVDLKTRALASLGEQVRHLARVVAEAPDGDARFAAIKGLVFGALCLPGGERQLAQGLRLLDHELGRQILADGGHVARSPSAHFRVFRDLVETRTALISAQRPVPETLMRVIDRMAPMLRFFRHGDGGLALFNDSNEEDPAAIDVALGLGEATGKPPSRAPHTGFERLAARRTLLLADTGRPPALPSRHTHAGPLSFELSVGKERVIVNCGAYAGDRPAWREAQRATAAHSTVTVDDTNAVEIDAGGAVARPPRVTCARHEDGGNVWLDATHDGYREAFGLVHRRRLYLSAEGNDLRGEDSLSGPGGKSFAVRFHLHPDVKASLVGDGAGALLRLPGGDGWRLRASGCAMQLAESVYLGRDGEMKRCEQVVLTGPLKGEKTTIKWALSEVGERN
ncbi:MAG: heparinase II/III family protein [Alphaproteobacteria bacterium]